MFDSGVGLLAVGAAGLAGLIEQNHAELMARECRMLQLACAWADAHYLDSGSQDYQPLIQRACAWGGEGTPEVSEYCAAELGALQGTGMAAARALIADALDLRYRLPRLWDRVLTGGVRAWQARKIAEQTRSLSWEACADVDHALSDFVGMMPWPRFAKILSATIIEADPALAAERAERARTTQDVFSFDSEDGLKTIVAKAAAGDVIWFLATVTRIAEILAARGDTDPIGARRARAVGILAQPAEALQLLIQHQHDDTDKQDDPTEPADRTPPPSRNPPAGPSRRLRRSHSPGGNRSRRWSLMIISRCRWRCRRDWTPRPRGHGWCSTSTFPRPRSVPVTRWCGRKTAAHSPWMSWWNSWAVADVRSESSQYWIPPR
jgi:hypothetical protein